MTGAVDNIRIYNIELSEADIARLYHQDLEGDRIEVLDSFPAHGSINAPRRETIIVRFSEPLDPSSLEGNIRLCYRNGGSCYATYVFPKLSSDSRIVTAAIPNFMSPLLPESFYELTVGSGVRSADGSRSMGVDQVISFQTGDDLVVGSYAVYDPDAVSSDTVRSSRVNNDRISTTSIDTVNAQDPVDLRSGDFVYENDLLRASGIGE